MRTFPLVLVALAACSTAGASAPSPAAPASPASPASPAAASPVTPAAAKADPAFEPLRGLLGSWQGSDPDHHSTGEFTLVPELGGKVLVRRSRNDSPQGHHEDLTIFFAGPGGLRASYYDNEGHIIQYAVTATPERIELLSDEAAGQPRFRLRYEPHSADELAIDFAIAMPGATDFRHYVGGIAHRVRS